MKSIPSTPPLAMRVLLAAMVALALGSSALAGCSAQTDSQNDQNSGTTNEDSQGGLEVTVEEEDNLVLDTDATIEETTLVDNDTLKVVAKDLEFVSNQAVLNLSIANKSSQAIQVTSGTAGYAAGYVNGFMVSAYINEDIPAGETIEQEYSLSGAELLLYGINKIGSIGVGLNVQPSNEGKDLEDYSFETLYQGVSEVKTSQFGSPETTENTYAKALEAGGKYFTAMDGEVLYYQSVTDFEKSGIRIESIALMQLDEKIFVFLEAENTGKKLIRLSIDDPKINDVLLYDGVWTSQIIDTGKRAVFSIDTDALVSSAETYDDLDPETLGELTKDTLKTFSGSLSAVDEKGNKVLNGTEIEYTF